MRPRLRTIRPLIETYAENIFIGGGIGSEPPRMTALQLHLLGTLALLAEAYTCAGKAGSNH